MPGPFRYKDLGSMATIGRAAAVVDLGWTTLTGYVGWLAWLFIHILYLIAFENRVMVMFQWAVAYLTYQRSRSTNHAGRTGPRASGTDALSFWNDAPSHRPRALRT